MLKAYSSNVVRTAIILGCVAFLAYLDARSSWAINETIAPVFRKFANSVTAVGAVAGVIANPACWSYASRSKRPNDPDQ